MSTRTIDAKFRLSNTMGITIGTALADQIQRYAEGLNISKSKVVIRAIQDFTDKPRLPRITKAKQDALKQVPVPNRGVALTWGFPYPTERAKLETFAAKNDIPVAVLLRRILFEATKEHAQTPEHLVEAAADAWL